MKKCFHVTAVASPMQQTTRCWFRVSADEHQLKFPSARLLVPFMRLFLATKFAATHAQVITRARSRDFFVRGLIVRSFVRLLSSLNNFKVIFSV